MNKVNYQFTFAEPTKIEQINIGETCKLSPSFRINKIFFKLKKQKERKRKYLRGWNQGS